MSPQAILHGRLQTARGMLTDHEPYAKIAAYLAGLVEAAKDIEAERDRYHQALEEIATSAIVERNPDGDDQAAATMQLIAREALDTSGLSRKGSSS
jgi:squalene cyclase